MAFTKITTSNLDNTINTKLASGESANASIISVTASLAPKIASVNVTSNTFSVLDDAAVNTGGGYIVLTGENFAVGATVLIDTTTASAVTRVNSTQLQVQVPAKAAASYNLFVVNPDGGVGIKVVGITYSSEPSWTTASPLENQAANTAFGVNLSATGASSYSVAAGSTLPAGTTLAANGYFSGTVSISNQTTYSFVITATDAELQDANRTFQVTVTVIPVFQLYTTGYDGFTLPNTSSPVQVGSATDWTEFASAVNYQYNTDFATASSTLPTIMAIKSDGTLWSWGDNTYGQLGHNNTVSRSSPTQVGTGTSWSKVDCGNASAGGTNSFVYTMAVKTDGTLWGWGVNVDGQLGINNTTSKSSPTQIGTLTNWNTISCSANPQNWYIPSWASKKTDGTIWLCGNNNYGQLGQGNTSSTGKSSPIQVGGLTNWSQVSAEGFRMHAVKNDGTMWAWGRAGYIGALGIDNNDRYSPTQVSGTNWSFVIGQGDTTVALKTTGTLWATGSNDGGVLGQNVGTYNNNIGGSPNTNAIEGFTQIGTNTNWSQISIAKSGQGGQFIVALKTDGTLWVWGNNHGGGLGLNNTAQRSSPTQVGTGTTWTKAVAKAKGFLAITSN